MDRHNLAVTLFLVAALVSFLLSIGLWFTDIPSRRPVRRAMGAVDPRGGRLLADRGQASMTGLDVLLALAGIGVTVMVIVGMVLITPRGTVEVHAEGADPQGSNPSSTTPSPDRSLSMPTRP